MGLKNMVYRMIGKKIAKKLDLKEGNVEADKKPWYKSKTVLSGAVAVIVAVYNGAREPLGANFGVSLPPIPEWVFGILGGIGIYGRVTANSKVG